MRKGIDSSYDPRVRTICKAADETVTNSAVMQDDNELVLPVAANAVYKATLHLLFSSDAAQDIDVGFTAPVTKTGAYMPNDYGTNTSWDTVFLVAGSGVGVQRTAVFTGLFVTGATAGSLQLQWAQNVAGATDTVVYAGSFLMLIRVN